LTWSTWVSVTLVDSSLPPDDQLIYNWGQWVAYDPTNNYACRYAQLNLNNATSPNRTIDMCDYTDGNHYGLYSYPGGENCTVNEPINGTLGDIVWPPVFLAAAKFLGINTVSGESCNHFMANNIVIDGQIQQLDIWTVVDTGYPCQVSAWVMDTTIHLNWAFDAFSEFIPPEAISCTAPQIICTENNWICIPKEGLNNDQLGEQLQWICNQIDCSPINPYGDYFLPNTVRNHANWAFNTYYQANRDSQGTEACDFDGTGEIIPPPTQKRKTPQTPQKTQSFFDSVISNVNVVC